MKPTADNYFSDTAEEFDSGYKHSPAFKERFKVWTDLWPKYLPLTGKALDLGSGSGILSFPLATKGLQVTGIDGAANMIALCNSKKDALRIPNVEFIASKIPFDQSILPTPYDVVISSSVLEYIEDIDRVLADVYAILKPGGIFIVSMPNRQAAYRKLERIAYKLIQRPKYMKYVQHVVYKNDFNNKIANLGFDLLHSQFYGKQNKLSSFLPEAIASTLFVSVFKKKTTSTRLTF